MVTKRIICFANSLKGSAHCVAGLELLPNDAVGEWIRPIGTGHEDALRDGEQAYADGTSPQLLDVLDVHLVDHRPQGCQTENWLVDTTLHWQRIGRYEPAGAIGLAENPETLFLNAGSSSGGINDQIPDTLSGGITGSLHLIRVPNLRVHVQRGYGNGLEVRGSFAHRGLNYRLKVTDPVIKAEFLPQGIGEHDLGACLVCISLAAPFLKPTDGIWYRYKVVAGVVRTA